MHTFISAHNLNTFLNTLIAAGTRVVAPRLNAGTVLYEPLQNAAELVLDQLPRRSGKEAFFPLCEDIMSYRKEGQQVTLQTVDPALFPETVLFGVRPCDAAAVPVLDAVFSWDYQDEFFLERRRKTTVIGLACTSADDACFCTAVGLSPAATAGSDLFLTPMSGGGYRCAACTEKGEALLQQHRGLFSPSSDHEPLPLAEPQVERIDLARVKAWLDTHFEDPAWDGIATRCVGCGLCAFVCPACHCFDIVDEGTEKAGKRRKNWDACGFWKFTHHASGHNPRDQQPKRYRNRIMHKFKYYDDKFGQTLCTGCGRCIRLCPVGIDIAAIVDEISTK
ncbi:4Fe-4S dicluster domain-containing protein [Trichlorobacter ammonificans]|uniref:Heterodisulfide reductase, iron-sulfur binding subunit n=1 Tax=Trichlorobacter ammonificans TaxID=2916410 RepID=A0ABM9DCN7_9BACT|nr:4Fe-4S dicluster domain-containing protein [Trichlorobacter ammonificans]CAH2032206.1 putative heterodisulfide reductase, iron-sulfur binding subunit [Trichlorobacter ammonificans]